MSISAPIITLKRKLPYSALSWEDFESLIIDLIRQDSKIEETRPYLKQGNSQQGIDLYAIEKLEKRPIYYQCKKWKKIYPSTIKDAIESFLVGEFSKKAKKFVFCTSQSTRLETFEEKLAIERERLSQLDINLQIWDEDFLNDNLYNYPSIVFRSFGINWVKAFNGDEAFQKLIHGEDFIEKLVYDSPKFYIPRSIATFNDFSGGKNNFYKIEDKESENSLVNLFLNPENSNVRAIVLATAGFGKSLELRRLAAYFSSEESTFFPILLYLKNFTGESIEEFVDHSVKGWKLYREDKIILILDGLDEVKNTLYDVCIAKINQFSTKFPKVNIVVSARNIAYSSVNDPNKERLQNFSTFYLEKPRYKQVCQYLENRLDTSYETFVNLLHKYNLNEWLELPFFLDLLIEKFLDKSNLEFPSRKSEIIEWFVEKKIGENKAKYINHHQSYARLQSAISKNAEKLAFVMTLCGISQITENQIIELFNDEDITNLRYSEVITSNGNIETTYTFEHNNFREFLSAKLLITLPFESIKNLITFSPTHIRIKPKWVNVLSFLYELLPASHTLLEPLSQWILETQPEILIGMEEDKLSQNLRLNVFKKFVLSKKQKSIYLRDENIRLERLAAFSGLDDSVIHFVLDELKYCKAPLFNAYRRDLIYILGCSQNLSSSKYKHELKKELVTVLNEETEAVVLNREAIECLCNNRLLSINEIQNAFKSCPSLNNLGTREGFSSLIYVYNLSDTYIDFLIDTISISEQEKAKNPRNASDLGWLTRLAILNINSEESLIKLLLYIHNHIYHLNATPPTSRGLPHDFLTDLFNTATKIKTSTDEVINTVYSIVDKVIEEFNDFHHIPVRHFFIEKNISRNAVLRYLNWDKPQKARPHFYVYFLTAHDFEWLVELLNDSKLTNSQLKAIIQWLKFYDNHELSNLYYDKYKKQFPLDPFSIPVPLVDWDEVKGKQNKRNQYLLINKEEFIRDIKNLFHRIGKSQIGYEDIMEYEYDNGRERVDLDSTLLISFIRMRTAKTGTFHLDPLIRYFGNEKVWDEFVFNQTISLIDQKKEIFEDALIEKVKNWFYENIYDLDFHTAKWDDDEIKHKWHYLTKAELLVFLFTKLNLEVRENKLLEMLFYDNSGINDYADKSYHSNRLSDLIIQKISNETIVRERIIWNLNNVSLPIGSILNHIRLVKKFHLLEIADLILSYLDDNRIDDSDKEEIVIVYASLKNDLGFLENIILHKTSFEPWMYKGVELLVKRNNSKIEKFLLQKLGNSDTDQNLKTFIANQLILLNNLEGFIYYHDYLLNYRKLPNYNNHRRAEYTDISSITIDALLPYFEKLLEEHYRTGFAFVDNEGQVISFLFENATSIAVKSISNLNKMVTVFERVAEAYKNERPAARSLYNHSKRMENNFYLNYPEDITITEAKIKWLNMFSAD